jgi:hypothetical protein
MAAGPSLQQMMPQLFAPPKPQVAEKPAAPATPKPISPVAVIDGDRVVQPGSSH